MSGLIIRFRPYSLSKKVALAISRGSSAGSTSFIVEVEQGGVVGIGEAAEFDIPGHEETAEQIQTDLEKAQEILSEYDASDRYSIESCLLHAGVGSSTRAAIDMALHDWMGKLTDLPVWKLLGLSPKPRGPISVTIGINTPDGAQARLRQWQDLGVLRGIKVKLGSPSGVEADKSMLLAIREVAPEEAYIGVDANGGWTLDQSIEMSYWLKEQGVVHIEQPLPVDQNAKLKELHRQRALPIFIDESCCSVLDVVKWGEHIDGINIKITKVGGITEAMRMISAARALGLETMVGCYGNTALGNGAAHHLASLIDYIDLDSHFNLSNDPTVGQPFVDGFMVNQTLPGLGIQYA